jgi:hypothetical protein
VTDFKDRPFEQRIAQMGDAAERKFEEWCASQGRGFVRYGLNRPPIHVPSIPHRLRYTPDYLTAEGLVECQGLGRKQVFMLKVEKFSCLNFWASIHPVFIFVWDSHKKRHTQIPLDRIRELIDSGIAELDHFPEGKAFFAIPADAIFAPQEVAA